MYVFIFPGQASKWDIPNTELGVDVDAKWAGLRIPGTVDLLRFSLTTVSRALVTNPFPGDLHF